MEDEDVIDIFIRTEEGKIYSFDFPGTVKCRSIKEKIRQESIINNMHFNIGHKSKIYSKGEDILHLNQGDTIYTYKTIIEESFKNIKFHENSNIDESDISIGKVSGILQICLLREIAKYINNVDKIKSKEIKEMILDLKGQIDIKHGAKEDVKTNLSEKEENNIIADINYFNEVIDDPNKIKDLLSLVDKSKQNEIKLYWSKLSKYEDFNLLFEKDFREAISKSYFDYSLVSISIYQHENRKKYIEDLNKCPNVIVKYLFHGSQIDPISNIITSGFLYTRKPFYGMGIYFSDMLDYVSFYSGGTTYENRRKNFGKTIPVGQVFSCIGAEVYYDNDKKMPVYDWSYKVKELDHFPTYDEIKKKYRDKMVEQNGVHYVRVEPQKGQVIKGEGIIDEQKRKGKFIGTEYVITEMNQILPLYGLTLKRNEYFVIWRDPNFAQKNQYSKFLQRAKKFIYKNKNINVYIESNTEKALEIIQKKRFNKIILITSVGLDLSGKTFVQIARKILGFDVMALFFSGNIDYLQWIKDIPNSLYTNNLRFCEKYVNNYNKKGLLSLKKEVESEYKINLEFNEDFLKFPKFINSQKYDEIIFEEICPNFRKVMIKNRDTKISLCMKADGTLNLVPYNGKDIEPLIWYVTIINNEITLFSNNYYLSFDETTKEILGDNFMKRWYFEKLYSYKYLIYHEDKNNVLTIEKNQLIMKKESRNSIKSEQTFHFIDV